MKIFISAGEPSGDLHGANLVKAFQQMHPGVECIGFGGERMEQAGCKLLYPLCRLAVMWFLRVFLNFPFFLKLLAQANRYFRHKRPDAVVLIDYPGFNWWIARRAHFNGIPVFYFIPPQLWGWAGWRVEKVRRFVDHVLVPLPFEVDWYAKHGVKAHHVGHPYFDELLHQQLDETFIARQKQRPGPIVAILPGSRNQEIHNNLSTLIRAATRIHASKPDVRFLVAAFKESQKEHIENYLRGRNLPIEVHVGRTAEIIHLAHSCMAVSGSVSLELLFHGKPSVVVYRISPLDMRVCRFFKTSRFIGLVNLIADDELFPEFLTERCEAEAISNHILRWLNSPQEYAALQARLAALRQRVGTPGACQRAAEFVLNALDQSQHQIAKAA